MSRKPPRSVGVVARATAPSSPSIRRESSSSTRPSRNCWKAMAAAAAMPMAKPAKLMASAPTPRRTRARAACVMAGRRARWTALSSTGRLHPPRRTDPVGRVAGLHLLRRQAQGGPPCGGRGGGAAQRVVAAMRAKRGGWQGLLLAGVWARRFILMHAPPNAGAGSWERRLGGGVGAGGREAVHAGDQAVRHGGGQPGGEIEGFGGGVAGAGCVGGLRQIAAVPQALNQRRRRGGDGGGPGAPPLAPDQDMLAQTLAHTPR